MLKPQLQHLLRRQPLLQLLRQLLPHNFYVSSLWHQAPISLYLLIHGGIKVTPGVTLIPVWISNYINYTVCEETIEPFPNFEMLRFGNG